MFWNRVKPTPFIYSQNKFGGDKSVIIMRNSMEEIVFAHMKSLRSLQQHDYPKVWKMQKQGLEYEFSILLFVVLSSTLFPNLERIGLFL